jgi:spore germination cell wall hydrolase CwlJ-like protein
MDWPITTADTAPRSSDAADRPTDAFFPGRDDASQPLGMIAVSKNALLGQPRQARFHPRRAAILLGVGSAGLLLHSSVAWVEFKDAAPVQRSLAAAGAPAIDLPPPDLLRPLSPDEAAKENAARPFVNRSDSPASRFVLRTDAEDRDRAVTCLAQAVYYEAAGEGPDGGRAVAQIVLNRMRHPGYPASVCGVVYQGADRTTGCQFTFTCDGSLLRGPIPELWARSRKIAEEALAGRVFALIGHATHYHADYVLPYWADSLDKTIQIGRHIFYRLRSVLGDSRSFFQRYGGAEPQIPQPGSIALIPSSAAAEQLANVLISDGLNGAARDVEKAAQPASPLAVDSARGTLVADGQAPPAPSRRAKAPSECAAAGERKQLAPLSANDIRSGVPTPGC